MQRKRKIITVFLAVLVMLFLGATAAKSYIQANLERLAALDIQDVDLSRISDGVYTGSHKVFPVSAEVEVTVDNHRITGIKLIKHTNGQGSPAEVIPDKVIEAKTLEVDTVAGATYSSKVILKAIENSLTNEK
jgi:uncharacterized protein with FMN-binding domain